VFASTTYNAGIFVTMEALISDLAAHNIQNRTVAIIENGSWAPTSGGLIRKKLETCKNIRFIESTVTLRSSIKEEQRVLLDTMAEEIIATFPDSNAEQSAGASDSAAGSIAREALFKLPYGLFVLTAHEDGKDNGCIINTVMQVADSPARISIAVNKKNYTHDMILRSGVFNVSVLSENVAFSTFERFGFQSGRDTDKFKDCGFDHRTQNGLRYIPRSANAVVSGKVFRTVDCGSHMLFVADITEAFVLSGEPSVTYSYYFEHIKPKPRPQKEAKKGFVCKICGYVYEGDVLPADYICPLCKHGAEDFEPIG
jgi:flavin reductase (DIM6/NTAB) family NADH-FMN oxidoreductase RutF